MRWFRQGAALSCMKAEVELGRCLKKGIGTQKNEELAFQIFQRLSKALSTDALCEVGRSFLECCGVDATWSSYRKASPTLRRAHFLGNCDEGPECVLLGHLNYRRLLGEREWEFDTSFADVLSYFPAPVCALRTLKAEIGCGMPAEVVERAKKDSDWLVAGKYGVIQFLDTRKVS